MKSIQVRAVSEETHAVLRRRAAEAGMSLQEYLRALLDDVAARPTVREVLARAGGRAGGQVGFVAAAAHLRAERDAR
ncbi:MAG: FitA-like ribbon-helix-helix domain-containing protein [Egibacteraceae bacterium]